MLQEEFFKAISSHYDAKLPLVAYRKPDSEIVFALLQKDAELHRCEDYSESGFVFASFQNNEQPLIFPLDSSEQIRLNKFETELFETKVGSELDNDTQKQAHMALVSKGIDAITSGELQKVVLSRAEHISISDSDSIELFKRLLGLYPSAMVYIWFHPNVGMWLGATPETLVKTEGRRFQTMALAGTQPFNGKLEVDWDNKNIAEQDVVTSYIEKELKSYTSQLTVGDVQTVRAGNLLHLRSEISGILRDDDVNTLISVLHPTPAVCGFPTSIAKDFIITNENYDREYYSGFLGELNFKTSKQRNTNRRNVENNAYTSIKNSSALFVNLRCMQLKDQEAIIYVGGGITKDSDPESEWFETINKAQTMKRVLS